MLHTLVPFRLLIKLSRAAGLIDEIRHSNFQLVMNTEVCSHMSAFPDHYSKKKMHFFLWRIIYTQCTFVFALKTKLVLFLHCMAAGLSAYTTGKEQSCLWIGKVEKVLFCWAEQALSNLFLSNPKSWKILCVTSFLYTSPLVPRFRTFIHGTSLAVSLTFSQPLPPSSWTASQSRR